jgi:hypothetical protein
MTQTTTMKRAERIKRRDQIVLAYGLAIGADFWHPLPPVEAARVVCAALPGVTLDEVFKVVRQAIREGNRKAAKYEQAMWEARRADLQADDYDAGDDFSRSLDDCYAAIRARIRVGGKGWEPPQ